MIATNITDGTHPIWHWKIKAAVMFVIIDNIQTCTEVDSSLSDELSIIIHYYSYIQQY